MTIGRVIKIIIFVALSSLFSTSCAGKEIMNQDSLWNTIKALKSVWGKQAEDVSKLLNQPIVRVLPTADDRFTSAPFTLLDGTRLSGLDIRLWGNGDRSVSLVSLNVDTPCIMLEQVREHFADVKLSQVPRGHATGQLVSYKTVMDNRGLAWAFGFSAQEPRCLKRITMTNYAR
ncbi:hypothetical protein ACSG7Z_003297 [Cronobacter dublinensis]